MFTSPTVPARGVTPKIDTCARPGVKDEKTAQSPGRPAAVTLVASRITEFQRTSRSTAMNPFAGVATTGTATFTPFSPPAVSGMLITEAAAVTLTEPPVAPVGTSFTSDWLKVRDDDVPFAPTAWKTIQHICPVPLIGTTPNIEIRRSPGESTLNSSSNESPKAVL